METIGTTDLMVFRERLGFVSIIFSDLFSELGLFTSILRERALGWELVVCSAFGEEMS